MLLDVVLFCVSQVKKLKAKWQELIDEGLAKKDSIDVIDKFQSAILATEPNLTAEDLLTEDEDEAEAEGKQIQSLWPRTRRTRMVNKYQDNYSTS